MTEEAETRDSAGPLDETTVQAVVSELIRDAVSYQDDVLSPERALATRRYNGGPQGNEEAGRSQVVMSDVRDSILQLMPDMLRIFHGPENSVEFEARTAAGEAGAKQATDYVNYVYRDDNPGFLITHSTLKDGFLKRIGIAKAWHEEISRKETYELTGVDNAALSILDSDDDVSYSTPKAEKSYDGGESTYSTTVTKVCRDGRIRVAAVPPEEFLYNQDARSTGGAILVGHRREAYVYELIALGFEKEELLVYSERSSNLRNNAEVQERNPRAGLAAVQDDTDTDDEAMHKVLYTEAYVLIDIEGEGESTLRRFHAFGDSYRLLDRKLPDGKIAEGVEGELVEETPFIIYTPDPEPHTVLGLSIDDYVKDIQRTKTNVLRATLDSLNLSLHPRTWAVMGQCEASDVLNTEIGAIIRLKQPGMVGEFVHTFVGKESFPMLAYFDELREQRTGVSSASAGLDPGALQSTTKDAVTATITGAQARKELIARIYAETFHKDLFSLIYKLVRRHQDKPRTVRLSGTYVEVDPSAWEPDMDVKVVVALGGGLTPEKIGNLMAIKATQELILSSLGPSNPLVTLDQYRNTLARIVLLQGFKNADEFFQPLTAQKAQQLAQQAAQQPKEPSPEMVVAQAQVEATKAELQIKQAELQLKQQEFAMSQQQQTFEQNLAMETLNQTTQLKLKELEAKYGAEINELKVKQAIEGQIAAWKNENEQQKAEMHTAVELHKAQLKAQVDTHKNELQAAVAKHKADIAPKTKGD